MTNEERATMIQTAREIYDGACEPLYKKMAGIGAAFYTRDELATAHNLVARPAAMMILRRIGLSEDEAQEMLIGWSGEMEAYVKEEVRKFKEWKLEEERKRL